MAREDSVEEAFERKKLRYADVGTKLHREDGKLGIVPALNERFWSLQKDK